MSSRLSSDVASLTRAVSADTAPILRSVDVTAYAAAMVHLTAIQMSGGVIG